MTILASSTTRNSQFTPRAGLALTQLHNGLWRVTRPSGDVVGYVEELAEAAGVRYRAKRLRTGQQRFIPLGEFWSADEAVECFRLG